MPEPQLYLIDFENVEEAIVFAKKQFPNQSLDAIAVMRMVQVEELEEGAGWSCMVGVCDICGVKEVNFLPTCIYENEITAIECSNCGNMSVYPMEVEMKEGDYD